MGSSHLMNSVEQEARYVEGEWSAGGDKKYQIFLSLHAALNYCKWTAPSSFLVNKVKLMDGTTKWELQYVRAAKE